MKVLITGSTGLVGSALIPFLEEQGHEVTRLVRANGEVGDHHICWDPQHCEIKPEEFEGYDVLINLAGENIASGRWTSEKKRKIKDSRVIGTHMLCELISRLEKPPTLLINASAIGYYGSRGDEILDEISASGKGFLAEVCKEWESATECLKNKGIRVVLLRTGVVLSKEGGALSKMLTPFKFGLGGRLGSGNQYISWIAIDDLIQIIAFLMEQDSIEGPVNAVSPNPVTNKVFTKTLGKDLERPTIFPVPAFMIRFLLGEMGEELLLSSQRVTPKVLENKGYAFRYPNLDTYFKELLP